jgi:thiol:disulfide interchange protein DsbD
LSITSDDDEILKYDQAYALSVDLIQPPATPNNSGKSLQLNWKIQPTYYLYKEQFFKIDAYIEGESTPVKFAMPAAISKYDEYLEETVDVYFDNLSVAVVFPQANAVSKIQLAVRTQGCKDKVICYPPTTRYLELDFDNGSSKLIDDIVAKSAPNNSQNSNVETDSPVTETIGIAKLLYTMVLALAGGVILNLMPCVFPVLSLKALSFVSARGSDHSHHLHGWAYTGGAVASFMLMGAIIVGIRAAGGSADWGVQLQSPIFVSMMIYLFLVMGLSLSGFVHFGGSFMGVGQSLTARHGLQGSFFTGVLAVVVASPCSAPFMAAALGVALTQNAVIALAIFASLGLGLALPFLILSYSPQLASYLPKPGAWMETLKQVLAFPLYLTAVWFLWVLGRQTSTDVLAAVVLGATAIIFAIWLWQKHPRSSFGRLTKLATCLVAFIGGIALAVQAPNFGKSTLWEQYSPELLAQLRTQGRPVFINMTAAWCTTCHANELIALSRNEVKEAADRYNVAMVKGDYTNEDPDITKLLNEYNRPSVPLYLMFAANSDGKAEILPQLLTVDTVVEAMQRAADQNLAQN